MSYDDDHAAWKHGCGCAILGGAFLVASLLMLRVFGRWYLGV